MHCSPGQGRMHSHCSVLLCKRGSQLALCQCNYSCGHLLCIQLCSDPTLKLCSTGPVKLLCHFSVLLRKTGSQHALCQCNYTCGQFLFIQLCSDPTAMYSSSGQGRMQSTLLNAALQRRLTTGIASMQSNLGTSAVHTGVTQHSSFAALVKLLYHCSLLLCKKGSKMALCKCNYSYGHALFTKVCNDPTAMHCSTGQGRLHSRLFSAALQNRHTAGLCLCNCTC